MAVKDQPLRLSGKYHYCLDIDSYQYVKKTGYLVKSPSKAGKIGRWRRRWFKLVDLVQPAALTGIPTREVKLEYYTSRPKKHEEPKMKGTIKYVLRTMYYHGASLIWNTFGTKQTSND